jgi:hypothetical protein
MVSEKIDEKKMTSDEKMKKTSNISAPISKNTKKTSESTVAMNKNSQGTPDSKKSTNKIMHITPNKSDSIPNTKNDGNDKKTSRTIPKLKILGRENDDFDEFESNMRKIINISEEDSNISFSNSDINTLEHQNNNIIDEINIELSFIESNEVQNKMEHEIQHNNDSIDVSHEINTNINKINMNNSKSANNIQAETIAGDKESISNRFPNFFGDSNNLVNLFLAPWVRNDSPYRNFYQTIMLDFEETKIDNNFMFPIVDDLTFSILSGNNPLRRNAPILNTRSLTKIEKKFYFRTYNKIWGPILYSMMNRAKFWATKLFKIIKQFKKLIKMGDENIIPASIKIKRPKIHTSFKIEDIQDFEEDIKTLERKYLRELIVTKWKEIDLIKDEYFDDQKAHVNQLLKRSNDFFQKYNFKITDTHQDNILINKTDRVQLRKLPWITIAHIDHKCVRFFKETFENLCIEDEIHSVSQQKRETNQLSRLNQEHTEDLVSNMNTTTSNNNQTTSNNNETRYNIVSHKYSNKNNYKNQKKFQFRWKEKRNSQRFLENIKNIETTHHTNELEQENDSKNDHERNHIARNRIFNVYNHDDVKEQKRIERKNEKNFHTTNEQQEIKDDDVYNVVALPKRRGRAYNNSEESKTSSDNIITKSPFYKTRSYFKKITKIKNQHEEHQKHDLLNVVEPIEEAVDNLFNERKGIQMFVNSIKEKSEIVKQNLRKNTNLL